MNPTCTASSILRTLSPSSPPVNTKTLSSAIRQHAGYVAPLTQHQAERCTEICVQGEPAIKIGLFLPEPSQYLWKNDAMAIECPSESNRELPTVSHAANQAFAGYLSRNAQFSLLLHRLTHVSTTSWRRLLARLSASASTAECIQVTRKGIRRQPSPIFGRKGPTSTCRRTIAASGSIARGNLGRRKSYAGLPGTVLRIGALWSDGSRMRGPQSR